MLKNSISDFALGHFSKNLGAVSEEQRERFHQNIKKIPGWWNVNMMGDYCWALHREILEISHKKSNIGRFAGKEKDSTRPPNKI
jgi:hypothetical protein